MLLAVCLAAVPGAERSEGYTFHFWQIGITDSETTQDRWHPDVWGPGETLVWEVLLDEGDNQEDGHTFSPERALRFVESALAAWSDIPSADISWRAEIAPKNGGGCVLDGRNTLTSGLGVGGACVKWERDASDKWWIVECDTFLSPGGAPHHDENEWSEWHWSNLAHEFGHCLGLGHSPVPPLYRFRDTQALAAQIDPLMSYGRFLVDFVSTLTLDDRIGASLLRPDQSWRTSVGSISGTLSMGDQTVPHGVVWAISRYGEEAPQAVSVISDVNGRFHIEGLPAGDYVLWTGSLVVPRAHVPLFREFSDLPRPGAVADLAHTVLPHPVRVFAGRETRGVVIPTRRLGVSP